MHTDAGMEASIQKQFSKWEKFNFTEEISIMMISQYARASKYDIKRILNKQSSRNIFKFRKIIIENPLKKLGYYIFVITESFLFTF